MHIRYMCISMLYSSYFVFRYSNSKYIIVTDNYFKSGNTPKIIQKIEVCK